MKHSIYIAILCILCTACGPKNVGESTQVEPDNHVAVAPENELRYPMLGSRTQQRLYYFNQPEIMQYRLDMQRDLMQRRMGLKPDEPDAPAPNDYHNLQPRQASPFRM